jgi:hypothetical protein
MRALLAVVVFSNVASSDDTMHIGLQLSSDADTQQTRLGGGVRFGIVKLSGVVDAQLISDGSDDVDLTAEVTPFESSIAVLAGWRTSCVSIERGRQWTQQVLVGATGALPSLGDHVHASFGGVFNASIVRHGDGLETDWVSVASMRHIKDTIGFSLFVRFDYESAL